ncbi:MAG: S-adenosylmethionine synthase [Proteobacteria bacterium]|nr:MAG: S-adenosylmethionine synthase [Pseudomonadota bacterium]
MKNYFFTSESVSAGHPDKLADLISDTILDDFLEHDEHAKVAVETLTTENTVVLAGEVNSTHKPNYEKLVKQAIENVGFDDPSFNVRDVEIINKVHQQSEEIRVGVEDNEGAGDQGIMFGYATDETEDFMPAPIHYANKILEEFKNMREAGENRLKPDAKSQITFEYKDDKPYKVKTILCSHQHTEQLSMPELKEMLINVANKVIPAEFMSNDVIYLVNPTGSFIYGGPAADTGLTGRKIIVDTYGGMARHGGGAFSGKDPSKVDRSAAYVARYLAKNIVAAGLAKNCEIQLCYAIGKAEPLAIYVDTFGTIKDGLTEDDIITRINANMDLTPKGIKNHLNLCRPIYKPTTSFGHFGRKAENGFFTWEALDLANKLK